MSRGSRCYESSGYRESHQPLPPIRDVVGDVLEQPVQNRSTTSSQNFYSSRRDAPPNHNDHSQYKERQLPPLRSHPTEYMPSRYSSSSQSSSQYPHSKPPRQERVEQSNHSYDVFVSSSQGLVHQRTSNKDDFRQSAKEEAISSSTGKHACAECGRRFEKLSHFKNHMNSHSGEKPYQCPWPGCGKTFSASSNMRRHERSHGNGDDTRKVSAHDSETWDSKFRPDSRSFYH